MATKGEGVPLESDDGVSWTLATADQVVDFEAAGAPEASIASSVLVEPDGSWTMYFYSYEGALAGTAVSIGRATAPDPAGPWTIDPSPVLEVGDGWDAGTVSTPTVVRTDSGYVMFYTGGTGDGVTAIGRADSIDGISWDRYEEPVFTATEDGTSWDSHRVSQPNLFMMPNGVAMVYKGNSVGALGRQHGLACSPSLDADGAWKRTSTEPLIDPGEIGIGQMIFSTQSVWLGDHAALFASASRGANATSTDVFGLLLPAVDRLEGSC